MRERSRPAKPLSGASAFPRTQRSFFRRISLFGCTAFCFYSFVPLSCRQNTVCTVIASDFCRILRLFSRSEVIPFFRWLCYSVSAVENKSSSVGFCWAPLRSVGILGHGVVILVTKCLLHFSSVCAIVLSPSNPSSENFVKFHHTCPKISVFMANK